ncbi:LuxR C-terminal-related transcriptional regulator [Lutibacter sp.]|uniref:helix-turn-helix and ligand-binding sensor domain-containing protein n=1 Tax=Lutibacter sp. TaxID=1925666 RepID=UPI0035651FEE
MFKILNLKYPLIAILFAVTSATSQIKLPPISNFNSRDYGAGNQNWGIDSDSEHIYSANNEGLLEYDGVNWRLNKLPNKTIIRSVKVVGNKIFTGSYEEFGYWTRSNNGSLVYTSLSKYLSPNKIISQSIWGIYAVNDKIIFKTFSDLFIYENGKLKTIKPNFILMAAFVHNNRFIVQGVNKGLLELKNDKLVVLKNTELLAKVRVQAISAFKNNQLLIGTSLHGLYTYENNNLQPWNNQFNNLLKEHELNSLSYSNGKVFAGTIKKGIYQYTINQDTFINLNVKNGLQNNTVLSSKIDSAGILWVALDNGISAIPTNHFPYYLNPYKEDIGAVYDMVKLNNEVYLATNTGIYKADNNGVSFIKDTQGHTWSLTLINNEIICGHNSGTYSILNGKLSTISQKNGGYVFKPILGQQNKFIQANYSGLTLYSKNNDKWSYKDVQNVNFPIKNIAFENSHTAWVLHSYKGVYRIHFSENYEKVLRIEKQFNANFTNVYDIKLYNIERNIAFYSNEKWYVYNSIENRIEDFTSFNNVLGKDKNSIILNNNFQNNLIVLKRSDNTIFIRKNIQDSLSQIYLPTKYYKDKLVRGEGDQRAVVVNDSLIFISLYNDVLVLNPKNINQNIKVNPPTISRVYVNNKPQDLLQKIELKQNDTLKIELKSPHLSNNTIEYSLGNNYWTGTNGNIELTGLPYGSLKILLRSFLNFKEYSAVNSLKLYIKPPWYMGFWGVILIISLLVFVFYFITIINKYHLIKHKKYLDNQFQHKQEILRKEEDLKNEIKLNELQKMQHEIELDAKTKELANTAMGMTRKDELLENIKSELEQLKKEIINKPKLDKLLATINKNINTSKDWEVFESNFNEIHDSFFKLLLKNNEAQLTPKDLKLCAYLKMNLATKEIAPLMGISTRGVEIHRYRLRKKLNLNNDQNLNEFFMKL